MADESYVALCAVVEHLHKENGGKAPTPEQLADALELSVEEAKEILAELDADPPVLAEPLPKKPKKEGKAKKEKKSLRGASQPAEGAQLRPLPRPMVKLRLLLRLSLHQALKIWIMKVSRQLLRSRLQVTLQTPSWMLRQLLLRSQRFLRSQCLRLPSPRWH